MKPFSGPNVTLPFHATHRYRAKRPSISNIIMFTDNTTNNKRQLLLIKFIPALYHNFKGVMSTCPYPFVWIPLGKTNFP